MVEGGGGRGEGRVASSIQYGEPGPLSVQAYKVGMMSVERICCRYPAAPSSVRSLQRYCE